MSKKFIHLEIEGAKGAPEPREIEAIEALLGMHLPQDFLDFLEIANGGYLDYCIRVPPDDELSFCQLYRAGKDDNGGYGWETFIGEIKVERQSKHLPREVLPFARDGGDSVVYLDLTPEGRGRVVAFLHGLPDWAGDRPNDGYVVLAPDFMSYTKLLYKCEDLI
jgi:hypothetical protein